MKARKPDWIKIFATACYLIAGAVLVLFVAVNLFERVDFKAEQVAPKDALKEFAGDSKVVTERVIDDAGKQPINTKEFGSPPSKEAPDADQGDTDTKLLRDRVQKGGAGNRDPTGEPSLDRVEAAASKDGRASLPPVEA